jgi:bilin biosynthesis protein
VAGNAIRALGRLGLAGSDSRVAELLRDPRPRVRQEAIVALGNSGDPAAVDVLQPLLDDEDSTVRRLALRALGEIGGGRARTLVETVARDARATDTDRAFARAALSAREHELNVARRADSPRVPVATVPRD